ncbi:hypothetical protein SAMN05192569_10795 [Parageobacillus thermantarcticus]|uniref:Uncharacterized protein n=1 Tax=Parageobacillus thermantarcticus TaxID=186116 RepID=A0A1I0U0S5_9BACL|nr:hypothetical protein [Parageobacillus thermantarcticus]SFA56746.1 hypothetical protein SAMN05192569_10795 [Parageobacillus thermantarcticus]
MKTLDNNETTRFRSLIVSYMQEQLNYYETLEKASVEENLEPFVALITTKCVEESLSQYLQALGLQ